VSSAGWEQVAASNYSSYVLSALENPDQIWEKPYRGLNQQQQNLLMTIFFSIEFGELIEVLRTNFASVNKQICNYHGQTTQPDDFENSLKSLETGFVSITGKRVNFVNPSLKDFLKSKLDNPELLTLLIYSISRVEWGANLWTYLESICSNKPNKLVEFANIFVNCLAVFENSPTSKPAKIENSVYYVRDDMSVVQRLNFLFELWRATRNAKFLKSMQILLVPDNPLSEHHQDVRGIPEVYWQLERFLDDKNPIKQNLLNDLQGMLWRDLNSLAVDELAEMYSEIQEFMKDTIEERTVSSLDSMISSEFEDVEYVIDRLSESDLTQHLEIIENLASVTGKDGGDAISIISDRIARLEDRTYEHKGSIYPKSTQTSTDVLSDRELQSLFRTLVK
jgi:hypothetical protein